MPLKIDFGSFSIPVQNQRLVAEVLKLDTDGNGTVNREDIRLPSGVQDKDIQQTLLKKATSVAFVNAGLMTKDQQGPLEDYIDLYAEVQDFRRAVTIWHQLGRVETYRGKKALAFEYADYCSNTSPFDRLPQTYFSGERKLSLFADRLHRVLHGFGKTACTKDARLYIRGSQQTCGYEGSQLFTGITYNPSQIPEDLQKSVRETVQNYLTGANWLFQFDVTYCGIHCAPDGNISLLRHLDSARLTRIDEGTVERHYDDGKKLPECVSDLF